MPVPRDRGAAEDTGKMPQADLAFGKMPVLRDSGEAGDLIVTSRPARSVAAATVSPKADLA